MISCRGTSEIGCTLQIRLQTTTLFVKFIVAEVPRSTFEEWKSRDHSCRSMVNVCPLQNSDPFAVADYRRAPDHLAGSGKSGLWYVL
jgi:hypothetical protein